MYRKLLVFLILTLLSAVVVMAQGVEVDDSSRAEGLYRVAMAGNGGYLGVELTEISNENYARFGLAEVRGVAIRKVLRDSPAEQAGLQDGDVIVEFNGEPVTGSRHLSRILSEVAPDHKVNLTVVRGGSEIEIPVTMGKRRGSVFFNGNLSSAPMLPIPPTIPGSIMTLPRPATPPFPPGAPSAPVVTGIEGGDNLRVFNFISGRSIGAAVTPLTKQLGDFFGVDSGEGLLINHVDKDSPAEKAGLRAGDVIVELDGKAVKSYVDFARGFSNEKEGDVQVTFVRDHARQTVYVTPAPRKDGDLRFSGFEVTTKESN